MQVRKALLLIGILSLSVTGATVFVQLNLARGNADQVDIGQNVTQQPTRTSRVLPSYDEGIDFERRVVTDTPFSATSILDIDQRMPDGSVSTKATTALIFRDHKGRTRRDFITEGIAVITAAPLNPVRSVINDPVAGFTYNLEHHTSLAVRKIFVTTPQRDLTAIQTAESQMKGRNQILPMSSTTDGALVPGAAAVVGNKPEPLAAREIEGVLAEGIRVSITVPAGAAGNEQPVEIVAERWYAPSIQAVVLIKRTDPIAGDSTYRLTNITRREPAAAMFTVPSNYTIRDESGKQVSSSRKSN